MKSVLKMLCVVAVVGFVSSAILAADAKPKGEKPKGLHGKVVKVDGTKLVITVGREAKETKEIATDDKTVVTVDGKEAKLADLKEGMMVLITPETGTAAKIVAETAKEHKKAEGKKAEK